MKMETIEDIVAEMRKRFEPYAKSDSNDARYVAYLGYAEFADRIEAAVKAYNKEITELLREVIGGVCLDCANEVFEKEESEKE